MKSYIFLSLILLMFGSLAFAKHEAEGTVLRDAKGFPRCLVSKSENYFF